MYNVTVEKDLVFARVDGQSLTLDIHRPDAPGPTPVVIYLHGGAWQIGDKAAEADFRLSALAAYGVSVVSANYRFVPDHVFPAQLHDAKAVVRWVRAHGAEHGLATERVGIWGASAGAYLATMVGLSAGDAVLEGEVGEDLDASSAVDAVIPWFGQSDLFASSRRSGLENEILNPAVEPPFLGIESVDSDADAQLARDASPLQWVTASAPPFLVVHGDRDRVIPISESQALHDALVRAGGDSTLLILGGAGHEGAEFDSETNLRLTAAFLEAKLR